jgi:hypothetical protein
VRAADALAASRLCARLPVTRVASGNERVNQGDSRFEIVAVKFLLAGRTWGLVRDTRHSIIDRDPWPNLDEAALYYYLLDFEENQPSTSFRRADEADNIWWFGFPTDGLPEKTADIPDEDLYIPPVGQPPLEQDQNPPGTGGPRLYGTPL